jgi:hypothetical protein
MTVGDVIRKNWVPCHDLQFDRINRIWWQLRTKEGLNHREIFGVFNKALGGKLEMSEFDDVMYELDEWLDCETERRQANYNKAQSGRSVG